MARVIGDGVLNLYIQDVIVAEPYRGKGYGTKLLSDLITHLKMTYPDSISVGLMAAKNQSPFYESFGFALRPCSVTDAGMQSKLGALHSRLAKTG